MTEQLTAVLEEPLDGGAVRLGVAVGPEGVTFLAQVRLYTRPALPAAGGPLDGHRGWARDFLERAREQMRPVIQAEACRVIGALAEENGRLREALADCVAACGPLLEGDCEGREGDHARAWLALERAREALTPGALAGPAGSRSLPGPR
jgi:hypothetical protein